MSLIQKLKVGFLAGFFALGLTSGIIVTESALADEAQIQNVCTPWMEARGMCKPGLREMVLTFVDWILNFLALVAGLFMMYYGWMYVTAGSNTEKTDKAKKGIIYSVVGLVIILVGMTLIDAIIDIPAGRGVDVPESGGGGAA